MTIIICLPGKSYSATFLLNWTTLVSYCTSKGYNILISQKYSCNIYYVRNMCLGGNVLNGENQLPFNGEVKYDYILWIDSDIIFSVEDFEKLLNSNKDIVSGLYFTENGYHYATVEQFNETFFLENGYFEFLTPATIKSKEELFPVEYTGFGFILIKYGVFEKLKYPWFKPEYMKIGNISEFAMEDVSFCLESKKQGFQIWINPKVIVGHEKLKIL